MMFDLKTPAADALLRSIASQAIDFARAGNKAGVIRVRYMARQIYDMLPFARHPRLMDLSSSADNDEIVPSAPH